jgi:hypothetical protein
VESGVENDTITNAKEKKINAGWKSLGKKTSNLGQKKKQTGYCKKKVCIVIFLTFLSRKLPKKKIGGLMLQSL